MIIKCSVYMVTGHVDHDISVTHLTFILVYIQHYFYMFVSCVPQFTKALGYTNQLTYLFTYSLFLYC